MYQESVGTADCIKHSLILLCAPDVNRSREQIIQDICIGSLTRTGGEVCAFMCDVSSRQQGERGNLKRHHSCLRKIITSQGSKCTQITTIQTSLCLHLKNQIINIKISEKKTLSGYGGDFWKKMNLKWVIGDSRCPPLRDVSVLNKRLL